MEEMTEGFRRLYEAARGEILPEVAAAYLAEGNSQFDSRNYAEAAAAFELAYAYDAGNEEALYQMAQSYRFIGEDEKAIAAYDKVIELFPDSWRAERSRNYRAQLAGG